MTGTRGTTRPAHADLARLPGTPGSTPPWSQNRGPGVPWWTAGPGVTWHQGTNAAPRGPLALGPHRAGATA